MAVTVQQAAANAAVAYLQTALPDVAVHSRWPGKDFPGKAITLIPAGPRRELPIDPRILSKTNYGSNHTKAVWQIAECIQPFQLDVWSTSHGERDDIMARLDVVLRTGFAPLGVAHDPVANCFFVKLADGWEDTDSTAKFVFASPDFDDTAESIGRKQFRAIYRGDAFMKLAIPAISLRQKKITLTALLDGEHLPRTDIVVD